MLIMSGATVEYTRFGHKARTCMVLVAPTTKYVFRIGRVNNTQGRCYRVDASMKKGQHVCEAGSLQVESL